MSEEQLAFPFPHEDLVRKPTEEVEKPKFIRKRDPRKWSGPTPGQTAFGMLKPGVEGSGLDEFAQPIGNYHADFHGNLLEPAAFNPVGADKIHETLTGKRFHPAVDLYAHAGGAFAPISGYEDSPAEVAVQRHWDRLPTVHVHSDSPIHTAQPAMEIENDGRIDKIRASLQQGQPLSKPAWLMRKAGRLYMLDGHHRVAAARIEGLPTFPAKIWDYDADPWAVWREHRKQAGLSTDTPG